jgi:hypothetical protein
LQEKQVAEPNLPEAYNNAEKEHHVPQYDSNDKQAVNTEFYESPAAVPVSAKKDVTSAEPTLPEAYNNAEKEHHIPQYDPTEKQAVNPEFYENPPAAPASDKKGVTLSRKTIIICAVVLLLVIVGLVGGLAGGLASKQHKSTPQASPNSQTSSSTIKTSISTNGNGGGTSISGNPSPTTSAYSSATKASVATSTAAPASYPSTLSTSNLVQNPIFELGLQDWSDPQHCWSATDDPTGNEDNVKKIARIYNNDANPGSPCSLTQTIPTVGAGSFMLAFLWGSYASTSAEVSNIIPARCVRLFAFADHHHHFAGTRMGWSAYHDPRWRQLLACSYH